MNKARRAQLAKLTEELQKLSSRLEDIKSEEEEYRDNVPAQGGEKYDVAEAAIDAMDNALTSIGEANDQLEDAQTQE